jgi:hypothetical protein
LVELFDDGFAPARPEVATSASGRQAQFADGGSKTLGETFERGRMVMGGVVKANGRANLRVTTCLRDAAGSQR